MCHDEIQFCGYIYLGFINEETSTGVYQFAMGETFFIWKRVDDPNKLIFGVQHDLFIFPHFYFD